MTEAERLQIEGCELAELHDWKGALGSFQTALSLDPGKAVLHELKAQSLLELEQYPEALQSARSAAELSPNVRISAPLTCRHSPAPTLFLQPCQARLTFGCLKRVQTSCKQCLICFWLIQ